MRLFGRLTWVEAKLFVREPLALVFTFALPIFMLIVLAGVFGNEVDSSDAEALRVWRGVGPTDYYAPAYVGLVMASIGLVVLPLRIAGYREQGVLRRFRAAGFPLVSVVGALFVLGLVLTVLAAIVIAVLSRVFYGALAPEAVGQVVAAFALGAVTFTLLGVALGAVLPTARAAQGAGVILFFVMMMLGGAGPPREVLADPMRWFGDVFPLTHAITALQTPWLGYGWDTWPSVWVALFAAGSAVVSLRFFRWE